MSSLFQTTTTNPAIAIMGAVSQSISSRVFDMVETWAAPVWLQTPIASLILILGFILLSLLLLVIFRPLLMRWVSRIVEKSAVAWDDYLLWKDIPRWASHFVCGLLLFAIIPSICYGTPTISVWLSKMAQLYMVIAGFFIFDSMLSTAKGVYQRTEMSRKFSAIRVLQLLRNIAFFVSIVLAITVLAGHSPLLLIGGLALTALVLMLVFKEPIHSFVAGIQLAASKSIAPGDWIEVPKYNVDGHVLEVALTTVRIQNFDKTITTIPTQALINESFKNWRSMQEAGGWRIKRRILIDLRSIKICNDWLLKLCGEMQLITEFVDLKRKEIESWNAENGADPINKINGRQLTNLGMFRAYIEAYLEFNSKINHDLTILVRQLQPTETGLPIEICCFTKTTDWREHEIVQADLFDHLLVAVKEFELEIFQYPAKLDTETVVNMYGGRLDQAHMH